MEGLEDDVTTPLRVLVIEDSELDTLLVLRELRRGGYAPVHERVATADGMKDALARQQWDLIISDYTMPHFSAPAALALLQGTGLDMPFVLVTGSVGEEAAVAIMKAGAHDYLLKDKLARLCAVVSRELREAEERHQRRVAEEALRAELARRMALAVDNARLYRQAQAAVRARDEFLSIASHELRTPLCALVLHLQGLDRSFPSASESLRGKLKQAIVQADRLGRLIEGLLDVSRITSRRLKLEYQEFDMAQTAREVAERFSEQAVKARCRLVVVAPDPVPGCWDKVRVEQIMMNLLSNATKYAAGKPIEVTVAAEGERAVLSVRDYGIGIGAEDLARIFGKFERAVPSRHYGGLGLGLYITRQIVEAHKGTIRVASKPGQGATFTVELPRRPPRERRRTRRPRVRPDVLVDEARTG